MSRFAESLQVLADAGNFRSIPAESDAAVTDLSGNDYLGIGTDTELRERFWRETDARDLPLTSSASRLLAARQSEYTRFERVLGDLYGRPALLFNSGYHANSGIIPALTAPGSSMIIADKLSHASIIDGIRLSGVPYERFRHNDMAHLRRLIARHKGDFERIIVVTESVFSMDGDSAPLEELVDIKRATPGMMLYVDEAHAVGVCGPDGLGLTARMADIDITIGTLGKACASQGAFAVTSPTIRDWLINRARSFIFSTAIPPLNCAWSRFVFERIPAMNTERARLRSLAEILHSKLAPHAPTPIPVSHIQPLIVGSATRALELSGQLMTAGFKVLPIRTPTVPPGTERLRFSLSLDIEPQRLMQLPL